MDHPNIVKFYQCVYDNTYVNIVMELVKGTTLSDYLMEQPSTKIDENQCKIILRQSIHAIKYFHAKGIVHRDLKLDNILVQGIGSNDLRIKMIDFGMSKITGKGNKKINLSTYCGTIDFIAPEIFEGKGYDKTCDIWSLGVIAYFILAGMGPFKGKDDVQIKSNIISCDFSFDDPVWENISEEA
jgi:serine/threonine protein kinase